MFLVFGLFIYYPVIFTGRFTCVFLLGTRVSVYAVHPGIVHTGIARHLTIMKIPVVSSVLNLLGRLLLKSPKQGCQTIVYCAVSEELVNESGMYYR